MTEKKTERKKARWRGPNYSEDYIEYLIESMMEFAEDDESCTFIEWLAQENLDYDKVDIIGKKFPSFQEAKNKTIFILGNRRESKALKGQWDSGIVKKSMALYDPKMREYELELRGHDLAARAAAQVAVMNYSDLGETKKQIDELKEENEKLKRKLDKK